MFSSSPQHGDQEIIGAIIGTSMACLWPAGASALPYLILQAHYHAAFVVYAHKPDGAGLTVVEQSQSAAIGAWVSCYGWAPHSFRKVCPNTTALAVSFVEL